MFPVSIIVFEHTVSLLFIVIDLVVAVGTFLPPVKVIVLRLYAMNINVKVTVILRAVLYGRGSWYLSLSEEHKMRVFENGMLRRILGSLREKVTGGWR